MSNAEKLIYAISDYFYEVGDKFGFSQGMEEILQVTNYLQNRQFNNFVEIGSNLGGSLWLYTILLCDKKTQITGIEKYYYKSFSDTVQVLKQKGYNIIEFQNTLALNVVNNFQDEEIDLLHIDDSHIYSETKANFETYLPKVKIGGTIIFHDVLLYPDVTRVFEEAKQKASEVKVFSGKVSLNQLHFGEILTMGTGVITKK